LAQDRIRILIVDDSALYRLMIRDVLGQDDRCTVVGHAENGTRALDQIEKLKPDLVTLDVEMPEMSGIDVLREINRRQLKTKVVMVSHLTTAGAHTTTDALLEGAFDFICKPDSKDRNSNKETLRRELTSKIAAIVECDQSDTSPILEGVDLDAATTPLWNCAVAIIGASTGGPEALRLLFSKLPGRLAVPIVIIQHMPKHFTGQLAARLDGISELCVVEAQHGDSLSPGCVFVAPGDQHLEFAQIDDQIAIHLTDAPPEHNCRPAVDYTLRSACNVLDGKALAVILTGMGKDGLLGSTELKRRGGRVIAQHAAGCTVFGMPKAVIEAGIADRVSSLSKLPTVLYDEIERGS
jgi:two-component system chemotaxis response regulator CheB